MISKQEFVNYLNNLENFMKDWDSLENSFRLVSPRSQILCPNIVLDYISLLEKSVGDNNEWIEWYAWDYEFGKWESCSEVEIDGECFTIHNAEDLYDVILLDNKLNI